MYRNLAQAMAIIAFTNLTARANLPANATVDQTLNALHDRGATLRSFTADLKLSEVSGAFATTTVRSGKIVFEQPAQGSPRMRVLFLTKQHEKDPVIQEVKGYQLDGVWLIDRDYHAKNEVRRQIAHAGEKVNLFQLGKGPFPLPIGQDPKGVHDAFDVTAVAAAADDPADTVHLQLTPKPGTDLEKKFSGVEIWVDRATAMPVRIQTTDKTSGDDRIIDLQHLVVNPTPGPSAKDFELPPTDDKWESHSEPL